MIPVADTLKNHTKISSYTPITSASSSYAEIQENEYAHSGYYIKDGVCFGSISVLVKNAISSSQLLAINLPVAKCGQIAIPVSNYYTGIASVFLITTDGYGYMAYGRPNEAYQGVFAYPVA